MAERLCCRKREEVKRKWHDKVTASSRAASEKSRKLAAEAKRLAEIPEEDSNGQNRDSFTSLFKQP